MRTKVWVDFCWKRGCLSLSSAHAEPVKPGMGPEASDSKCFLPFPVDLPVSAPLTPGLE